MHFIVDIGKNYLIEMKMIVREKRTNIKIISNLYKLNKNYDNFNELLTYLNEDEVFKKFNIR